MDNKATGTTDTKSEKPDLLDEFSHGLPKEPPTDEWVEDALAHQESDGAALDAGQRSTPDP